MSDDYRALRKLRALQVAPRKSEVLRLAQKRAAFYGGVTNSSSSSSSSFHGIAPAQRAQGDDYEEAGERMRPSGRITPSGMSVHVHGSHLGNAESMKSLPSDSQLEGGSKGTGSIIPDNFEKHKTTPDEIAEMKAKMKAAKQGAEEQADDGMDIDSRKEQYFHDFDDNAVPLMAQIEADPNSSFKFDQAMALMGTRSAFNPFQVFTNAINDFLLPPAVKPHYDKEQQELAAERRAELAAKRAAEKALEQEKLRKARGDKMESEEEKKRKLTQLQMAQTEAPQIDFAERYPNGVPPNYERGPLAAILNPGYTRKGRKQYVGGRHGASRHGIGEQTYENGDSYKGLWNMNLQEGWGVLTKVVDKTVYDGQWHLGKQHGLGVFRTADGSTYQGQWREGFQHGFGEWLDRSNGTIYSGEWRDGARNGFGTKAWLRNGSVYVGQWVNDSKHGPGILKSGVAKMGIGRFYCLWENGVLLKREVYDTLIHGTEAPESSAWTAHYAKEAAIEGRLVQELRTPYPLAPERPKRMTEITTVAKEDWPEWVRNFRATFNLKEEKRERVDELEEKLWAEMQQDQMGAGGEKVIVAGDIDPDERHVVVAREFKRLITLVHSSDAVVEQLMLPILNTAEVEELPGGEQAFVFGGIYRVNLAMLKEHFASKIQRMWRSSALRRAVRKVIEIEKGHTETDEERQARLEAEYQASHEAARRAIINALETQPKVEDFTRKEDDSEGTALLRRKLPTIFGMETNLGMPSYETGSKMLLHKKIYKQYKKGAHKIDPLDEEEGNADGDSSVGTPSASARGSSRRRRSSVWSIGSDKEESGHDSGAEGSLPGSNSYRRRGSIRRNSAPKVDPALFPQMEKERKEAAERRKLKEELRSIKAEKKRKMFEKHGHDYDSESGGSDSEQMLKAGVVKLEDGTKYSGQLLEGVPQGYGRCIYPDGGIYSGQFARGCRQGLGVYTSCPGRQGTVINAQRLYAGEWDDGCRHGFGVEQLVQVKTVISSVCVEYQEDIRVAMSFAPKGGHSEWLEACQSHALAGNRAAHQSKGEQPAVTTVSLAMSEHIEFSTDAGIQRYGGEWDSRGYKQGLGVQTFHDGTLYAGDWVENMPNGYGREKYPDGSNYLGQFRKGRRHGYGRYVSVNGVSYVGQWNDGVREGQALETMEKDGAVEWRALVEYTNNEMDYIEAFHPRKAHSWLGRAEIAIRDAARITGRAYPAAQMEYEPGNPEGCKLYVGGQYDRVRMGAGIMLWENGRKYVGEWLDDSMDGYGAETYPDDSIYHGQFRRNQRHGYGRYHNTALQRVYSGEWHLGRRHGKGWERVHVTMVSGLVVREFLVEYEYDYEISRKLLQDKSMYFVQQTNDAVERAEKAESQVTMLYSDLLD